MVGPGIHLGRPEGHDRGLPARALRRASVPVRFRAVVLPVHRALGRGRPRLRRCAGARAAGSASRPAGSRSSGSGMVHPAVFEAVNARLGRVVYDPEEVTGLRLRPRHRARGHDAPRRRRHPAVLRERPALPGAVPGMKVPLSAGCASSWTSRSSPRSSAEDLTLVGLAVDGLETDGRRRRPRPRRHHQPRRLHERLRRGPRGGGRLRPAAAAARPSTSPRRARRPREALDVDDRGARPVPALLRAGARRARWARRRPGCATAWRRSACAPSATWSTSPTT